MKYAYLGPEGTFTQAALCSVLARQTYPDQGTCLPYATVPAALQAVRRGECAAAMVPVENSRKGVVPATLEGFAASGDLHIVAEAVLEVTFTLMGLPGSALAGLERVLSHPHALAQCGDWLSAHLPGARLEPAGSTAGAAQQVRAASDPRTAAVAAPAVAERYGLSRLAEDIGECANAVTRFVMLRPAGPPPARTGRDRTSLLVSVGDRTPAALPDVLSVFCAGRVSLAWVHAWPTGARLGNYRFFVDVHGHVEDQPVSRAIAALPGVGAEASFLGSYPSPPGALWPGSQPQDGAAARPALHHAKPGIIHVPPKDML
jgi:prephenate dehydratase